MATLQDYPSYKKWNPTVLACGELRWEGARQHAGRRGNRANSLRKASLGGSETACCLTQPQYNTVEARSQGVNPFTDPLYQRNLSSTGPTKAAIQAVANPKGAWKSRGHLPGTAKNSCFTCIL